MRSARADTRRLMIRPVTVDNTANQAKLPTPMPSSRTVAVDVVSATCPTEAALKTAAQDAMVIGLEAVAITEVRKAARGASTSPSASAPARMRVACQTVRAPSQQRNAAPSRPKVSRTGVIRTSCAAPSTPRTA